MLLPSLLLLFAVSATTVNAIATPYFVTFDELLVDPVNSSKKHHSPLGTGIIPPSYMGLTWAGFNTQANTAQVYGLQPKSLPNTAIINALGRTLLKSPPIMSVETGYFAFESMYMGCELDFFPVKVPVDCVLSANATDVRGRVYKQNFKFHAKDKMKMLRFPAAKFGKLKSIQWSYVIKADVKSWVKQPQFDNLRYTVYT